MAALPPLERQNLPNDPFALFRTWLDDAIRDSGLENPNAMFLSTVGEDWVPEGRIVLLKGLESDGFVFFTNRESRKGRDLDARPRASLGFFWDNLGRQVRIVGSVARVSDDASDDYFASRPRGSQIGAWASHQSRPLASKEELEERVRTLEAEYLGREVPRPDHWGGYVIRPHRIEFWQSGEFRLHDRFEYALDADRVWNIRRLNP